MADPVWLVRRSAWGARDPKEDPTPATFDRLAVHYTDTDRSTRPGHDWCARIVKAIQDDHMDTTRLGPEKGNDGAYGALSCDHSYVFEMRGPAIRTAANGQGNNDTIGAIAHIGNEAGGLSDGGRLGLERAATFLGLQAVPWIGHGNLPGTDTSCPGSAIRAYIAQRKGPTAVDIDDAGKQFIVRFEGFRPDLHNVLGVAHVGYGHKVSDGPVGSNPEAERPFVNGITKEEGWRLFEDDLRRFVDPVARALRRPASQDQFNAMVSLAFNVGLGTPDAKPDGFLASTVLRKFNEGDLQAAGDAFLLWNKARNPKTGELEVVAGLTRRREAEREMFLRGAPVPIPVPPPTTGDVFALVLASGMVLDVQGRSQEPGAPVIQWRLNGGPNQLVREIELGHGEYAYVFLHSGMVLDVVGERLAPGTPLCQWWFHGKANQRWTKFPGPGRAVRLQSGGMRLDLPGFSLAEGQPLHVWDPNELPPQDLLLVTADAPYGAHLTPVPEPGPQPSPDELRPAPGPPPFPGRAIREGDRGEHVETVQARLAARGWAIAVDGVFGPGTKKVVEAFQREKKLAVDGIVGQATWDALWNSPLTGPEPAPPPPPPPATGGLHPDPVGQIQRWGFEDVAAFQMTFAHYDIGVDGRAGAQTARAVQVVAERGGFMSQFFHMNELRSKGNGRIRSHRQLLRRADEVRRRKGPFVPVSPYRDPRHNSNIGAVPNSQHVYGTAFDIPRGLISQREAAEIGFSGIGTCGNGDVLHVDVRAEGPNNTTGAGVGRPTIWRYPC